MQALRSGMCRRPSTINSFKFTATLSVRVLNAPKATELVAFERAGTCCCYVANINRSLQTRKVWATAARPPSLPVSCVPIGEQFQERQAEVVGVCDILHRFQALDHPLVGVHLVAKLECLDHHTAE